MSASAAALGVIAFLAQVDEIGLLRVDPIAPGAPVSLEVHSQSIAGSDVLLALTKADEKIGKSIGKKVVRFAFGFDHDGDGHDEILVATESTTVAGRPLTVKIFRAPSSPSGDLGAPIASLKTGALKLDGPDRVVAMCAIEFDGDARDELCVVRGIGPPMNEQRLEVFDVPTGKNKKLGALLASDWTFGPAGAECFAITAADIDLDERDELFVLRRDASGNESLDRVAPPSYPIGEAESKGGDPSISASDGARIEAAFAIHRDGPMSFDLALLRRAIDGSARLDLHTAPSLGGGELAPPFASEVTLDATGSGDAIVGAFAVEHDARPPWADFEGAINAFFRVAYPDSNGQIVTSWIGPVPGLVGSVTPPSKLSFDIPPSMGGSANTVVTDWSIGAEAIFAWNSLRLDVTKPTGIALPGTWVLVTLPSVTIEAVSTVKNRLRYVNPGGPIAGTPCGELQMLNPNPSSYQGPPGPPTEPQIIVIALVMEFYLEKP